MTKHLLHPGASIVNIRMFTYVMPRGRPMWPEIPPEDWNDALDRAAEELLERGGCQGPPVDALLLAQRLGLVVALDNRQASRARCVRLNAARAAPQPLILLKHDPRPERRHWAVAHEIGEQFGVRVFQQLGIDAGESAGAREQVAAAVVLYGKGGDGRLPVRVEIEVRDRQPRAIGATDAGPPAPGGDRRV